MRIRMNIDYVVCLDGVHPSFFKANDEIEVPINIATVLLEDGRARLPAEAKMEPRVPDNKMIKDAPEDKMIDAAPETKAPKSRGKK